MLLTLGITVGMAVDPAYAVGIDRWRREREARLRAEDGWLTVTGLFWLEEGENRLPPPAPGALAPFVLAGGKPSYQGKPLRSDVDPGGPDRVTSGDCTLFVIRRGDRIGVRLKDKNAEARRAFRGLHWYPVKPELRIVARFVAYDAPRPLAVPNVLGQTDQEKSPGYALFTLGGQEIRMDPVLEDGHLFFVFRDQTSGKETYPAGRFLNADLAQGGQVVLDFNQAYNPPCAFTAYATCPLPPRQNRLPVRIEAGERFEGHR